MADVSKHREGLNTYHTGVGFIASALHGYKEKYTYDGEQSNAQLFKRLADKNDIPVTAEGQIHAEYITAESNFSIGTKIPLQNY